MCKSVYLILHIHRIDYETTVLIKNSVSRFKDGRCGIGASCVFLCI